ncbi:MAG: ATP-binding protein, partial [Lachnospiraceae bacterium]|nr:ATP-binding protein [Lachnospiraceae bacterium]
DKTLLIRDILDAGAKISLFTRPRRFGKTLALSMLKAFFEDERDGDGNKIDNSRYFEGKRISDCGEKYRSEQEKYPVINLTLKSAKQPNYEMAYNVLRKNIMEEFDRHSYILQGSALTETDCSRYRAIWEGNAEADDYATALAFLSRCLKKYHDSNVIILIDEYDVPLENSYFEGFYDRMIVFLRSLFESALKTNDALEFAVITGCLRISKESIFTGLNNLDVVSILRNDCAEAFGFTAQEVQGILSEYGMGSRMEEVREWYDGYLFGNTEVYNPWSIISYVNENRYKTEFFPKPYWSNTSSNSIIRELVEKADRDTRGEIEQLIAGGTIEKPVHEDITYGDIRESQDNLWNFLFFTGYLKKAGERFEEDRSYLTLAVPNREIRCIYRDTILSWFDKRIKAVDRMPFYRALLAGECDVIERELNGQLIKSISFYDAAEQFYHGFMAGMLGGLGEYRLYSNREAGDGRPDLMLTPEDWREPVMIFELKKADKFTQLEAGCEAALAQIEERHYDAEYKEEGYERFIKYGICFCGKACRVKAVMESAE